MDSSPGKTVEMGEGATRPMPSLNVESTPQTEEKAAVQMELKEVTAERNLGPNEKGNGNEALHMLASLAAGRGPIAIEEINPPQSAWHDVGMFKFPRVNVRDYYVDGAMGDHPNLTSENLHDFPRRRKVPLQPGTAYRFRVAAVNSAGRGEWSEESHFMTSHFLPDIPANGKVYLTRDGGAYVTWEPPRNARSVGPILEYCVSMAIKPGVLPKEKEILCKFGDFIFANVYCGKNRDVKIAASHLKSALISRCKIQSNTRTILFRVAAKNRNGYGTPTQVTCHLS